MQPTKQDRITSVLRKIRAYQNKPIVVAPGEGVECVRLNPIEAILLANHITHLEDMIATLENLLGEAREDAEVYKRRALNTAQAGREAEARIRADAVESFAKELRGVGLRKPEYKRGANYAAGYADGYANRLRNGGSEKFFADEDKPLLAELDKASERHVQKFERNGGSDGE